MITAFGMLAAGTTAFTLVQLAAVWWQLRQARSVTPELWPSIAVLRPCEGREPALRDRLASALHAAYPGSSVQLVAHGGALDDDVRSIDGLRFVPSSDAPEGCNRKAFHLSTAMTALPPETEVVVAIDADVEVTEGLLRSLVAAAIRPGAVAAFAPPVQQGRGLAARLGRAAFAGSPHAFVVLAGLSRMLRRPPPMVGCAVAIRRDALDRVGGFTTSLHVIGDDLALGEALARVGTISLAHVAADCRNPEQGPSALLLQLARWIRVAVAHGPLRALSYPLVFAPMVPLFACGVMAASCDPHAALAGLGIAYSTRVLLAWTLRARVYGRPWESLGDPLLSDAMWFMATLVAAWPSRTRWAGRSYRIGAGGRLLPARGTP